VIKPPCFLLYVFFIVYRYDFFAREAEVAALESVSLKQIREWWATFMSASSPKRRKLAVHIIPTKECPASATIQVDKMETDADVISKDGDKAVSSPPKQPKKRAKNGSSAGKPSTRPAENKVLSVGDLDAFKATCDRYPNRFAPEPTLAV
jgi:hypothetical protein